MNLRKLSEVAPPSTSRVKLAPEESIWHLTLDQIESGSARVSRRVYGPASEAASSSFKFDDGNVLYSKLRPYLNKVVCPDTYGIATTELVPLRPNPEELNREYLCFFLRSPGFVSWASAQVDGAKMPRMKMQAFWQYELPVPPLDDQIRIAHLLGKVEGLIAQRKEQLEQLDELLKSVFLEMFGDPVRNEKGWEKKPFSSLLLEIDSGKSPKCEARPATTDEWGVLKLGAVTKCTYIETENKALPENVPPSTRDEVKPGDLLFSRKNTYDLVAACAFVFTTRSRLLLPDLIFRFVFKPDAAVNPIYIWKLLTSESQRRVVQSLAAGAAGSMPNISKTNLRKVLLPIPPLELQDAFGSVVTRVESLKSRYQQSLTDLESLYSTLSQQAFKGELDLSRVPLPDAELQVPQTAVPVADPLPATPPTTITLPDTELLQAALDDRARLRDLLPFWLEAYRTQLMGADFSAQAFLATAQTRIAEQYPESDFALGIDAYEYVKAWVLDKIKSREIKQTRDIITLGGRKSFGNRVVLRARGSRRS